jgi:hypothetical protein
MKGYFYFRVFEQLSYLPYFFATICKVAHFVLWCLGSVCTFCFSGCGSGFIRFVLYSLFHSMFLTVFLSVCFNFLAIGYVCHLFSK